MGRCWCLQCHPAWSPVPRRGHPQQLCVHPSSCPPWVPSSASPQHPTPLLPIPTPSAFGLPLSYLVELFFFSLQTTFVPLLLPLSGLQPVWAPVQCSCTDGNTSGNTTSLPCPCPSFSSEDHVGSGLCWEACLVLVMVPLGCFRSPCPPCQLASQFLAP